MLEGLARQARAEPVSQAVREAEPKSAAGLVWFAFGAAVAGAAFVIAAFLRLN